MIPAAIRPGLLRSRLSARRNLAVMSSPNMIAAGGGQPTSSTSTSSLIDVSALSDRSKEAILLLKEGDYSLLSLSSETIASSLASYIQINSTLFQINSVYDESGANKDLYEEFSHLERSTSQGCSTSSEEDAFFSLNREEQQLLRPSGDSFFTTEEENDKHHHDHHSNPNITPKINPEATEKSSKDTQVTQRSSQDRITLKLEKAPESATDSSWYDLVLKFKCSICQDVLASPCAANCSHSYCGSCLLDYMEASDGSGEAKKCCLCKAEINNYVYVRDYDAVIEMFVKKVDDSVSSNRESIIEWEGRRSDYFRRAAALSDPKRSRSLFSSAARGRGNDYNAAEGEEGGGEDFLDMYGDLIFYSGAFLVVAYGAMSVIFRSRETTD